ncbi:MAG: 1,3-beta-galactosyl-N-acetylhexosamine phosphorylase, partial [Propionibacteriaceae bacterium]|nr:1,3-beta-galactosyl-N-acetylhexosamine phosphorylase [Propionibacteriaceae bacterium]
VDREIGWGLSTRRYPRHDPNHFIVADLDRAFDPGESTPGIVPVSDLTQVLRFDSGGDITLATNTYGAGRAVYASGLPWSPDNNRLLHRAIHWAANDEAGFSQWIASDPRVEIAHWPTGAVLAYNMASEVVTTTIHTPDRQWSLTLPPGGSSWQIP